MRGFRRGIYTDDVDFHVGNPTTWITDELQRRGGAPFLTHALLDLPGPVGHLKALSNALLPDGVLGVFCPSVTQIGDCLKGIRNSGLQLGKDIVVEFPPHAELIGAGLRGWNIKYTTVRARAKAGAETATETESAADDTSVVESSVEETSTVDEESGEGTPEGGVEVLVCRPSVGERLVGGGFFGIFRKKGEC